MNDISPALRLSIGLVFLTISIILVAQALGLTPDPARQKLESRQQFSESMAIQSAIAVQRDDGLLLQTLLKTMVDRHKDVQSAAIRRLDQTLLMQSGDHSVFWQPKQQGHSTPTHVQLPIIIQGRERGYLEISFTPLNDGNEVFGLSYFSALIIFIAIASFIAYWFYIGRALRYLDPSAVIPTRVKNALNILTEGVLILDPKHHIVLMNKTLANKLGGNSQDFIGKHASELNWLMECAPPWEQALDETASKVSVPIGLQPSAGADYVFQVNTVPILDEKGRCQGTMSSFEDVTELEEKNHQLEHTILQLDCARQQVETQNKELKFLASSDPLTGCYNRRSLFEFLNNSFTHAKSNGLPLSCVMADIDHFKNVNDTYGHAMGDKIIKLMADTLKHAVRAEDVVARYGGEEFCLILPGADIEKALVIAERCRKQMTLQDCDQVQVTASFGVTTLGLGAKEPMDLISEADQALYISKEGGRNCVSRWDRREKNSPMRDTDHTETHIVQDQSNNNSLHH